MDAETTAWAGTMTIMTAAAGSGYSLFSSAATTKTMDAANLYDAFWRAVKARHYFNNYM